MPDETYPAPHRPTLADLDPESVTTDRLIALARGHREGLDYPTPERLLANLPTVLRALCDVLLAGEITVLDAAYRVASIVDVVENVAPDPTRTDVSPRSRRH
jgi:hypothetical protein